MAGFDPTKLEETLNKARLSVDSALTNLRASGALGNKPINEDISPAEAGNTSCTINTGCDRPAEQ
ncbi:hypothetical protein [Streptomyces phaeoluteigriseus]|uniref:hypothetical protein n=1 Tax=Streptomyces phaeoluteigriseus TaxID=114686 RepID=UPI0036C9EAEF